MADLEKREEIERLDEDLDIMERHAQRVDEGDDEVKEALRRRDRDFKNDRFHSVPRPRKHVR